MILDWKIDWEDGKIIGYWADLAHITCRVHATDEWYYDGAIFFDGVLLWCMESDEPAEVAMLVVEEKLEKIMLRFNIARELYNGRCEG